MIKIPLPEIINKIKDKANVSEEEVNRRIEQKLKQLSGLISKEGAAHIVANELGVKLLDTVSGKLQIKNIMSGMRDVETVGKALQVFDVREFKTENRSGKVASMVIGDETGTIRLALWGNQADNVKNIKEGDIVKILGGYVRDNNGRKEVHLNDRSKLVINPEGESVGDVKAPTTERKNIADLSENDNSVEVLGTIVQAFEPRFFEICKECGKRMRQKDDALVCLEHGKVVPDYAYVLTLFLDDGTDNIRAVFFRDNVDKLLNLSKEQIIEYKNEPAKFEEIKTELVGTQLKVTGRVNKNSVFDRIELIVNKHSVAKPEEEIKRLSS